MKLHISREHLTNLLSEMIRIRRFEERCAQLYTEEKIRGFLHLYIGEEAIAVGVMQALEKEDTVFATYREHGHALAKGLDMNEVMAEMYGKLSGSSKGRGGSMHIFDYEKKFYGGNAIVGGALPMAVGVAMADKLMNRSHVTVCFFGEGAVAEGEFHESLNLAKLWDLPVLFVCENNGYAMGTALKYSESQQNIAAKAESYGLITRSVDGMNVVEVETAAIDAVKGIRNGSGPQLLECHTYRLRGHSMFDTQQYRSQDEVNQWLDKGPIAQMKSWLLANVYLNETEIQQIEDRIDDEVNAAIEFAEKSDFELVEHLTRHVYAEPLNMD